MLALQRRVYAVAVDIAPGGNLRAAIAALKPYSSARNTLVRSNSSVVRNSSTRCAPMRSAQSASSRIANARLA